MSTSISESSPYASNYSKALEPLAQKSYTIEGVVSKIRISAISELINLNARRGIQQVDNSLIGRQIRHYVPTKKLKVD